MNLIVNAVILTISWFLILTLCNSQNTTNSTEKKRSTEIEKSNELPLSPDKTTNSSPICNSSQTNNPNSTVSHRTKRDPMDCYFSIPPTGGTSKKYYTPIIFITNTVDGTILHPSIYGLINIKKNSFFKLSCPGSYLNNPYHESFVSEITVKCSKKQFIKYKNVEYQLSNFSCSEPPKATIKASNRPCQGNNTLLNVGFQTEEHFIALYRICFDRVRQNPIYSWYIIKRPVPRFRQFVRHRPKYFSSERYDGIDVARKIYTFNYIKKIVKSRVNSTILTDKYVHLYNKRFLKQEQLSNSNDFLYLYEGLAAFFTENTVPQWRSFNTLVWKDVESSFRYENFMGVNHHVVLTGTYLTFKVYDDKQVKRDLYLNPPNRIPVPLYIWKMDYDIEMDKGIVYVGLNNPYVNANNVKPICNKMPCLKGLIVRELYNEGLLYCCSKESFEKTYGQIDPVVNELYR